MAIKPALDSPDSSQSLPPSGLQGDLELELLGLANALYNLRTTVINDSTKERDKPGSGSSKPVRMRVNEVINHLATIDDMAIQTPTWIPLQRLEHMATENQFMNGKITAVDSYHKYFNEVLIQFSGFRLHFTPLPNFHIKHSHDLQAP
ncbi:hypothetical protein F5146DRAFT_1114242 [Armillaria mellea]|nr:hypothetical protein F5146DRAFT_1114242 [Armillaria mellea]